MILAANIHGMLDMADQINLGRIALRHQERHEIDSNHAAFSRQSTQLSIVNIARMIVQIAAACVADHRRRLRFPNRLRDGGATAVAQVHHYTHTIQLSHQIPAEIAQPGYPRAPNIRRQPGFECCKSSA